MNPWEEGMTLPDAFHGVGWYELSSSPPQRTLWGRKYPYFYNPMPAHWSDSRLAPGGTYAYTDDSNHIVRRWNLFDQVLLRSATLKYWPANHPGDCLRIINKTGAIELTAGLLKTPDRDLYSDHLPILFRLGVYDETDVKER